MFKAMNIITNVTINPNADYRVFIRSEEHPRTINTFDNQRTYYTANNVKGENLMNYIEECVNNNIVISEIFLGINTKIIVSVDRVNNRIYILK